MKPKRIAITGAAGQIGYQLVFRVASGDMLGRDQPVSLHLLEITPALEALQGVVMELRDAAFPLLHDIVPTDEAETAFDGIDYAVLVGARPRGPGMERKDLLQANAEIISAQGKALNDKASPDARVLVAGQDAGMSAFSAEIFSPPYLFKGQRPGILATPQRISYNQAFSLATSEANQIGSVALIAPTATTHSVNTTQRYVGLDFSVLGPNGLSITAPPGGNHAPPSYYMLFIVDQAGVPSIAET